MPLLGPHLPWGCTQISFGSKAPPSDTPSRSLGWGLECRHRLLVRLGAGGSRGRPCHHCVMVRFPGPDAIITGQWWEDGQGPWEICHLNSGPDRPWSEMSRVHVGVSGMGLAFLRQMPGEQLGGSWPHFCRAMSCPGSGRADTSEAPRAARYIHLSI